MECCYKILLVITFTLVLVQFGCQGPVTESMPKEDGPGPRIKFEKTVHDFGEVSASKKYKSEFRFTNIGDDLLRITDVKRCCGVVVTLDKKEFAPGESGTLKFEYNAGRDAGLVNRLLRVFSNDETNPKAALTIKAKVVIRVDYQPKQIDLLLNRENAGCPKIIIRSLDEEPFSITSFQATDGVITAKVDPKVEATVFELEPKVDPQKHKEKLAGLIAIGLTHPELNKVTIAFRTKPRFQLTPGSILLLNPRPQEPSINKVTIVSNYDEDFEIESISSKIGLAKVLNKQAIKNGYRLEVEVIPPPSDETRMFGDVINVRLEGGETLAIKCFGRYLRR
jgi:hypothetical protein